MIGSIVESILSTVAYFLFGFFWWYVLFPVVMVAALPFVLLAAVFSRKPYREAVLDRLVSVHSFWHEWGVMFVP